MGQRWQAGQLWYQDCDACGLSYREDGMLRANHEDGSCVNAFGRKEDKKGYGADTQAETWGTGRVKVTRCERPTHKASSHIVETPAIPDRTRQVETGYA